MYKWEMNIINDFNNEKYKWLSNFYPSKFIANGKEFCSVEQYYQYEKAIEFNDFETADKILNTSSPGKAKSLGRDVKNFDDLVWNKYKINIMKDGLYAKFTQNSELYNLLLSTGSSILIEGNQWQDTFWGVVNGEGQNNLGLLLMLLRNELRILKENEC